MSRTLLIAPHADDETLFASYLAQRYAAHIVVVYDEGREIELRRATEWIGCPYTQLTAKKGGTSDEVYLAVRQFSWGQDPARVIFPDIEEFGHEEHNLVGEIAAALWPLSEHIRYRTYSPRGTRSHGTPSQPERPEFIARKLAALSCYRTQIETVTTRPWFYDLLDMREWTA